MTGHRTSEAALRHSRPCWLASVPLRPLFHFSGTHSGGSAPFRLHSTARNAAKAFIHSELEQIEGIGDKTVRTLLQHFRTVAKVRVRAGIEELSALVGAAKAKKIKAFFEK